MPDRDAARAAGAQTIAALRRRLATKAAEVLKANPERMASAVELGLVDRSWLESPTENKVSTTAPIDVLKRFIERSVEDQPSIIGQLGVNAIQLMSWSEGDQAGTPQPLTILFTDLEGFTSYTAENGDAAAIELLGEHQRRAGRVIRSRGGRVVKRIGDGLLVVFNAPEAGLLAAVELEAAERDLLRLRAGIHVGEAVITADDVIGHDVNLAARVADDARGGEILATEAVCTAVGDLPGIEFGRVKKRSFKGVDERVGVCSVRAL